MSERNTCPKCGCTFVYPHFPLLICPKCGHNHQPHRLYEAIPSKQTMLDALETCRANGLSNEEYERARKAIEEQYSKQDEIRKR